MSLCIFSHTWSVLCMSASMRICESVSVFFASHWPSANVCFLVSLRLFVTQICVFLIHWVSLFMSASVYLCLHISESGHVLCLYVSLVIFFSIFIYVALCESLFMHICWMSFLMEVKKVVNTVKKSFSFHSLPMTEEKKAHPYSRDWSIRGFLLTGSQLASFLQRSEIARQQMCL